MKLELKIFDALCATKLFRSSGINADTDDLGHQCDDNPVNHGCNNMTFHPAPSTPAVLEKYQITETEYQQVTDALDGLSFGNCGWCA